MVNGLFSHWGFGIMKLHAALAATALGLALASPAKAITFVNALTVPTAGSDLSGLPGVNGSRLGGFGSDLIYDRANNTFYALPDRGPGGGTINYAPRYDAFSLSINTTTGAIGGFTLNSTTLFTTGGANYTGLNPLLATGSAANLGRSLDPEGLARLANGNLLVSDEYGPSVLEFAPNGTLVRAYATPANLVPKRADGTTDYVAGRPDITTGRQDNRGFEGITVSPDGTKAYAVMQDPLVNEGLNGTTADGRPSRNVRIVEFNTATGTSTAQYIYQLETTASLNAVTPGQTFNATAQGRNIGLSGIQALPDGRLLVLERDNRGWGVDDPTGTGQVALKGIYIVSLTGATNVANVSLGGTNTLPSGVTAVSKTLFLDVRSALIAAGVPIAEKIEGFAFGPRLANGGISLILASDNDFSVTQNGSGTQFDVCTSGVGGTSSQVALGTACPTGTFLLPNYFYSFALSSAETQALGLAAVPEPGTWALMLAGLGLTAAGMRRRKVAAAESYQAQVFAGIDKLTIRHLRRVHREGFAGRRAMIMANRLAGSRRDEMPEGYFRSTFTRFASPNHRAKATCSATSSAAPPSSMGRLRLSAGRWYGPSKKASKRGTSE
jgi:hypothetical protein